MKVNSKKSWRYGHNKIVYHVAMTNSQFATISPYTYFTLYNNINSVV